MIKPEDIVPKWLEEHPEFSASDLSENIKLHVVRMNKYASTWSWYVGNPQGGGFGSNLRGSKKVALAAALRGMAGRDYILIVNDKFEGRFTA